MYFELHSNRKLLNERLELEVLTALNFKFFSTNFELDSKRKLESDTNQELQVSLELEIGGHRGQRLRSFTNRNLGIFLRPS